MKKIDQKKLVKSSKRARFTLGKNTFAQHRKNREIGCHSILKTKTMKNDIIIAERYKNDYYNIIILKGVTTRKIPKGWGGLPINFKSKELEKVAIEEFEKFKKNCKGTVHVLESLLNVNGDPIYRLDPKNKK